MASDLLLSKQLEGLTGEQVVELLGQPDGIDQSGPTYYYDLGVVSGWLSIGVEIGYLKVLFYEGEVALAMIEQSH